TRQLTALGQRLWLDKISRTMLEDGSLRRYIDELGLTGLTSNPTIFDEAIAKGGVYDASIRARPSLPVEAVFLELAIEDLRRAAGLELRVASVASLFVSRWDRAVHDKVPAELRNRLGLAVARRTYRAYRELLESAEWRALAAAGARPQRLLWASTGTKDPEAR